jgi:hypothetical protein
MNTRLTFLTLVALALLTPSGARAQAKNEAKSPPTAGGGREAIIAKLERIRLDKVRFEDLPLSEVVVFLKDQAQKRDPENKGINFLLNPNLDAGEAAGTPAPMVGPDGSPLPAAPAEQLDLGSVSVRIMLPLNDVRLLDVLDAVVKVADKPIKYTIEDYGVVISPRGGGPARREGVFAFPGGTPSEFLAAVERHYKVDWLSVADIPKEMADVHIPRFRLAPDSSEFLPGRTGWGNDELAKLVALYNGLGVQKPELGKLLVEGGLNKPSLVMFVPDKAAADTQPRIKVMAFSISGITEAGRAKLQEDIDRAKVEAASYAARRRGSSGLRNLEGTVAIHNDTSLLVATGPEPFVEMVQSIVTAYLKERAGIPLVQTTSADSTTAYQAKERAGNPGAPESTPKGK